MNFDIASLNDSLLACAVCMGGDDATTTAANFAIGFMAVLIIMVLGSIIRFMFYLARQQKLAASEADAMGSLNDDSSL